MEIKLLASKTLKSKLPLALTILISSILVCGCNKNEAKIGIAKLVGFKVLDQRVDVETGQWHHANFTAKHTGAVWTYVKTNNSTPVQVTLVSEDDYENLSSNNVTDRASAAQDTYEGFVASDVEAGKKYYLLVSNPLIEGDAYADVTIQSYFLGDK